MDNFSDDKEALVFKPSQASWALVNFVNEPPVLLARAFVYSLALFVPAAFLAMFFFKVQASSASTGILVPRSPLLKIVVPSELLVTQVHVKQNQKIKAGQVLFSYSENGTRAPASTGTFSAAVDGSVISIGVSAQSPIHAGDVAVTVLPSSTPLEVEVEIPNQLLDLVHENMEVQILLPAAHAKEYYADGMVREIQSVIRDDGREPSFKVRVLFLDDALPKLRIGQAVQVRFGTRQERLITVIFNKILNRESVSL